MKTIPLLTCIAALAAPVLAAPALVQKPTKTANTPKTVQAPTTNTQ